MESFAWEPGRTAGPSTALRSGRDDNFVGELTERRPLCGSRDAQQVPRLRYASVRDDKMTILWEN
jgi:hypothetical protein